MTLTRITKGVIQPNQDFETRNVNSTGIVTATGLDINGNGDISGNLSVGGVLTYEDVTSIDSVGVITARGGIDCNGDIDVDGHTNLDNLSIAGVTTTTDDIIIGADNKKLKLGVGEELQLYQAGNHSIIQHNGGHYLLLRSNSFGIMDAAGTKNMFTGFPDTHTSMYYNGSYKIRTQNTGAEIVGTVVATGADINGDIDVDGHTNLDNVSVAGISTFSGIVDAVNTPASIRVAQDIQHKGDADTKISFPQDNNITFETSGSQRVRIDSLGRIGISQPSPQYKLDILETTNTRALYIKYGTSTNNTSGAQITNSSGAGNLYLGVWGPSTGAYGQVNANDAFIGSGEDWSIHSISDTGVIKFGIGGSGPVEKMRITSTGVDISRDLDVDGHTNLDNVSIAGVSTFSGDVKIDAGTSTTLTVEADSAGVAMVKATGGSGAQATAAFELVQSTTSVQGGGISYNGDGSPAFASGETQDATTFYRITSGTRYEVFSYPYNSNTVTFNGDLYGQRFHGPVTGNLTGTVINAAQPNITSLGTLTGLSVSGTTSPISFTHTGGNCVTFNRNSKQLAINANYAGQNGYSNIIMTSGMDIRWTLGGQDRINFKSAGHIEPVTDSSINLGADAKRFANVYADTLYGDGSNLTGISGVTINNNADNRIITGSGTAATLNGESTITYDNPTLEINTDTSPYGTLILNGTSGGLVQFEDNEVAKWSLFADSTFSIYDNPGSANRLRITGSGSVMINKTSSFGTVPLQVKGASSGLSDGGQIFDIGTAEGSSGTRLAFGVNEDNFVWIRGYESGVGGRDIVFGASEEKLRIDTAGQILPGADDAQNLGSSTKRWKNIYAADMHFSNKGKTNDVDGTWGDWTLQEGEDSVFMINNRTGKKYAITMKEVN